MVRMVCQGMMVNQEFQDQLVSLVQKESVEPVEIQ